MNREAAPSSARQPRRKRRRQFTALICAIMILPSFLMTAFSLSSLGAGLALVLLWIVAIEGTKSIVLAGRRTLPGTRPRVVFCVSLLAGVLVHAVLARATIPEEFDLGRFGLSYVYLVVMLVAAVLLVHRVTRTTSDRDVQSAILFALALLSLSAVFGLTGFQFLAGASSKQTGLFSEPSHLALVVAPVLVYLSVTRARHHGRYLLGFFFWALTIQNLTMIVAVALAYVVSADFKAKQLAIVGGLLALLLAADIPYFADRLFISEENSNLSVLVFLQGWQNAFLLLEQSMGVGGGFQQFGLIGEFGELTERITQTSGFALNLYDGGSTASKLIGEFGYAGFVLLAAYGYAFVRCMLLLRNRPARERLTLFDRFTMACLISYVLEIGVRGVGYFSPGTFLLFVALINLQAKNIFFPRSHAGKRGLHGLIGVPVVLDATHGYLEVAARDGIDSDGRRNLLDRRPRADLNQIDQGCVSCPSPNLLNDVGQVGFPDACVPRRHLVISAVNLVEGGTLKILRESLSAARSHLGDTWRITAIVHCAATVGIDGIEYLELPKIKRSWLARIRFEYVDCRYLSRTLRADFWFSLHDMTPVVTESPQAVYCHNAMCFHRLTLREAWLEPKLVLFSSLYALFYRINLHANKAVVVQQSWLRDEFVRRFGCRNVIVSHPVHAAIERSVQTRRAGTRFFYPSLPRVFKNFETLLAAWASLCVDPAWQSELVITLDGGENRYARALRKRFGGLRNVRFAGRLLPAQVAQEFERSDCLVFPSKLETWGLPLTEAKQHGLAILAADLPYAHEAVGHYDAASFFSVNDAAGLAQLMRSFSLGTLNFVPHRLVTITPPFAADWPSLFDQLLEVPRRAPQQRAPSAAK